VRIVEFCAGSRAAIACETAAGAGSANHHAGNGADDAGRIHLAHQTVVRIGDVDVPIAVFGHAVWVRQLGAGCQPAIPQVSIGSVAGEEVHQVGGLNIFPNHVVLAVSDVDVA